MKISSAILPAVRHLEPYASTAESTWKNRPVLSGTRLVLLATTALVASSALVATVSPAQAVDATWLANPGSNNYNDDNNWNPAAQPISSTAFFGASSVTNLTFSTPFTVVGGWTFNAGAPAYTFSISGTTVSLGDSGGAGIVVNGGSATIMNDGGLLFFNSSTAANALIVNNGAVRFLDSSTAGTATINNNNNSLNFEDTATAGSAIITNSAGANLRFFDASTGGSATITNNVGGNFQFYNASTAGSATITNNGAMSFTGTSNGGTAGITNNGTVEFFDSSAAASATITNNSGGVIHFNDASSAGTAHIINTLGATLSFNVTGTAGSATITNNGALYFQGSGSAGGASILNNNSIIFQNSSTAETSSINNLGTVNFFGSATGGSASIGNAGTIEFFNTSAAGNAFIVNGANLFFGDTSTAGTATIVNNSLLVFGNSSTAGSAQIGNNSALTFNGASTAGVATIVNSGTLVFGNTSTAGSATIANAGTIQFFDNATAGNAALANSGVIDFSSSVGPANDGKLSAGSIAGAGLFYLGAGQLTVGGNNLSTTVSGVISDCGAGGAACINPAAIGGGLVKTGTGTLTLAGLNTYTGLTFVNAGTLSVNGSIASSALTTVNAGGTLGGNGIVGNTTVAGGTLAPGNSIGLLTVQGSLMFTAAASYLVEVSPANADRVNVTGSATLGNATVNANFAAGSYVAKQYTILNATGGVSGTFNGVVNTNLPAGFASSLSYDANNAYLNLTLFSFPTGLNTNQQNVANALVNFFNTTGGIPLVFGSLTPTGLTQVSGETATGAQQTTFDAMNLFMGLMTDPFIGGRGEAGAPGALSFTEEAANAYAGTARKRSGAERDAYATVYRKAAPAPIYNAGWSAWTAGFGGSQTTVGNAVLGSNDATSRIAAGAVGFDYRFSPDTVAGFALAGGGTSFSVANGGNGRSDLFQAGAFLRHTAGAAYLAAAAAYGWQDITTDRTVTVAGADHLRAEFKANAYSGRVEGGYRFVAPWLGGVGITPYAAGQFTTFDLPAYAESVVAGTNAFALAYGAKSVTATRSELGLRSDKSFAMPDGVFTLRGRAAWAHDFNPDRNVAATFQSLPGASFVVNGAAMGSDSALVTGAAEMKWLNGWSAAATFEGEFSNVTRSYAGKGVVRYAW